MMTKVELKVIEWFLDASWGSTEMREALDELIAMADLTRRGWDAKDRARLARKSVMN